MSKIIESFTTANPYYGYNTRKVDSRYTTFQRRGPLGLVLHSVGCAQPSASVFVKLYNKASKDVAVHAFIDANTGEVRQTMPWNFRVAHVGGSANNTHCGIEMCESSHIKYTGGDKFIVRNKAAAVKHCETAYKAAVELFAYLCKQYHLDPMKQGVIISHNEARLSGVGAGHTDPEHYWRGLGVGYTMDGFRHDVKAAMETGKVNVTVEPEDPHPTLRSGSTGNAVVELQKKLIALKYSCGSAGADGDFGAATLAAVKKFQRDNGLVADGIVGAKTWAVLEKNGVPFVVRVTTNMLNIRRGPSLNDSIVGVITGKGAYTIVQVSGNFGKLKSGAGWICLDYVTRI